MIETLNFIKEMRQLIIDMACLTLLVLALLKMSDVRSSDLEPGLSLFDDRVVSEATSVSTPIKLGTFRVPLRGRTSSGLGIGFSSLIQ